MKALIVGGSGYTGGELIRILEAHPKVDEVTVTSRKHVGKKVTKLHPKISSSLKFADLDFGEANECDMVFLCVPHTTAMDIVPEISAKIVDLSADYRLHDKEVYEKYYGVSHKNPKLLSEAVYGLPELHRGEIRKARIVANPGCYATNIILALYPLLKLSPTNIVVDSFSGYSGAGRANIEGGKYYTLEENIVAYKVTGHRHIAELSQELGIGVSFVPHVVQLWQGMHSTIHAKTDSSIEEILDVFNKVYKDEPFTKVLSEIPQVLDVEKTNECQVGGFTKDDGILIYFSVTDNLIKGASGQAVQNMNLMMGYNESEGL